MPARRLVLAAIVTALSFCVTNAEVAHIALRSQGNLHFVTRTLPTGAALPEAALAALAAGPTAAEQAAGVWSALPAGTQLTAVTVDGTRATVEFSESILADGIDDARSEAIYQQVRATLEAQGLRVSAAVHAAGSPLYSYLPPVCRDFPPPAMIEPQQETGAAGTALSGRKISLSPGHGLVWNGTAWGYERGIYCAPLSREDLHNVDLMAILNTYLLQDGATIKNTRCVDKNYGNYSSGTPWWYMSGAYWLKHLGYPCSVYASYTDDCNLGTGASESSDSLRSRPLASDYDNSDLYVSVHTNGFTGDCTGNCPNGTLTGYDLSSSEHATWGAISQQLALAVNTNLVNAIRTHYNESTWQNRGIIDSAGGSAETRIPNRAAILIEVAFHDTCDRDGLYLQDNFFRSITMWGSYAGICQYLGVSPTYAAYSCDFVSDTIPATMTVGQSYNVSITFRNRGLLWNSARGFALGAVGNSDPFTGTTRVSPSSEVWPNTTWTFNFTLTAPATPGAYTTDWQMLREGVTWFGPQFARVITVNAPTGNLTGTVTHAVTAMPISGATVTLSGVGSTTTNGSGVYTFNQVAAGNYTLTVSATGFNGDNANVTISTGATTTRNFALTPLDTQPPTVPTNLVAVAVSATSVQLTWTASTDDFGVIGYDIRRDGSIIASSPTNSFTDNTVAGNTSYMYEVRAQDGASNYSSWSNQAQATTPPGVVVVFQDGFDGGLGNWTQSVQGYDYSTVVNHGAFTGSGAAFMGAGQSDQMYYRFARPFAQGTVKGYYWDARGGWQQSVCGWAYRQAISLRDADAGAKMYIDNEFYSAAGNANYFYRLIGGGSGGAHTAYALRDPGTDCNGVWIAFQTTVTPGAPGESLPGTFTAMVTDRAGTTATTQNLGSDFFAWGFARITLGLGNSSPNEGYWDDISLEATPPGKPTLSAATALSDTQIRWNFAPADSNHFGWDVAQVNGAQVSPGWPATGWLDHNASSWTESGLAANTVYSRKIKCWNGTLDSQYSEVVQARTLPLAPGPASMTPDEASPCVGDDVTWTVVGGFGAGQVEYYAYAWDTSPTYTFSGIEPLWGMDTLTLTTPTPGTWYLHVKAYNADHVANGTYDYSVTATHCAPPTVTAAVSRKTHGNAGVFDIDVAAPGAVESRSDGPTQVLVITFNEQIEGANGLDPLDVNASSGSVTGVSISGPQLAVDLSNVTNAIKVVVAFPGIVAIGGNTPSTSVICFGALTGDTNGDSSVNSFDLVAIRNALNQTVSTDNFRRDVNADGAINIFDMVAARQNLNLAISGSCLP